MTSNEQNLSEASTLYQKARVLMEANQFENAIPLFQRSAEIDPHFKTLELLGESYIHLNRLQEAIIPLAAAVSLNRGVRAVSLLAIVFLEQKNYNAAKDMAEIALSRDSSNKKALKVITAIEKQS